MSFRHHPFFSAFRVPFGVFALAWKHHQIFWIVVVLVSIDVMDDFSCLERSAEDALCHRSVFVSTAVLLVCLSLTRAFVIALSCTGSFPLL